MRPNGPNTLYGLLKPFTQNTHTHTLDRNPSRTGQRLGSATNRAAEHEEKKPATATNAERIDEEHQEACQVRRCLTWSFLAETSPRVRTAETTTEKTSRSLLLVQVRWNGERSCKNVLGFVEPKFCCWDDRVVSKVHSGEVITEDDRWMHTSLSEFRKKIRSEEDTVSTRRSSVVRVTCQVRVCKHTSQCSTHGLAMNWLNLLTEYVISGRVTVAYCNPLLLNDTE
ncbi:hypothetical protein PIB30_038543 [Stylosanthes scabra]|uniref:Uncharacterized protein n=1 Tax=Stylosanthes scabra TaxID=79078 RepID=A0ABU6XEW0_9FABA|nr:hypothetical protein [Stylosanthes scabra]